MLWQGGGHAENGEEEEGWRRMMRWEAVRGRRMIIWFGRRPHNRIHPPFVHHPFSPSSVLLASFLIAVPLNHMR